MNLCYFFASLCLESTLHIRNTNFFDTKSAFTNFVEYNNNYRKNTKWENYKIKYLNLVLKTYMSV